MNENLQNPFLQLGAKLIEYLPSLLAGTALILIGWILGWLAKRIIIRLALLLKLERFLSRFRWGRDFSKADVRYGFYSFIGNTVFFIVFLVFLNDAAATLKLTVISRLLEGSILLIPRFIAALFIFGTGWLLSTWAAHTIQKSLKREDVPGASFIARFSKGISIFFFSAMALAELSIAREVVIIGFTTILVTVGVLTILLAMIGGKEYIKRYQESGRR